jgi:hypothetical protein
MTLKDSASPVIKRLAVVLNWLQCLVLLVGFCGAGFLFGVYAENRKQDVLSTSKSCSVAGCTVWLDPRISELFQI